jgi:general secretion pathway protein K
MVTPRGDIDKRRAVMCERMFSALAIDPSLVYNIVDWEDTNDVVEQNGAEFSYYTLLTPSYEPRNGQFLTSGELLLVKGFDRDLYFIPPSSRSPIANEDFEALDRYITVYGDGEININTAQEPVLLSLSKDMDEYIAQDIMETREKAVFETIEDLKKVKSVSDILYNEIRSLITVKSGLFRITSRGVSGNFTQVVTAVVVKESKGFRVVYYNRSL